MMPEPKLLFLQMAVILAAARRTHYWYQHEPCWYVRKKSAHGSARPEKTRRSGSLLHLNSSWEALTSRSMINGSKRKTMSCSAQKITAVVLIIAGAFFTISEAPASHHY